MPRNNYETFEMFLKKDFFCDNTFYLFTSFYDIALRKIPEKSAFKLASYNYTSEGRKNAAT